MGTEPTAHESGYRVRLLMATLGVLLLALNLWWVHAWYDTPFAVWTGWDEAYIAAFAGRLLDHHSVPFVDAVSHRGPILYWLAELAEVVGDRYSWHTMRVAALVAVQAAVWTSFLTGVLWRRPLAGFFSAAALVFMTAYGMAPKDGIGFNGEIVAVVFTMSSTAMTVWALDRARESSENRVIAAAIAGLLGCLAGLTKQVALVHLLPLATWWFIATTDRRERRRVMLALIVGVATPVLSVLVFYARVGHLRAFFYYFYTYNRDVYMGPITLGRAIEASFLFSRDHMGALSLGTLLVVWGWARWLRATPSWQPSTWLHAMNDTSTSSIPTIQATLASVAAFATFRFWDHYFISAIPWLGLLGGVLVEEHLHLTPAASNKTWRATRFAIVGTALSSTLIALLTLLWLTGQRKAGQFGDPKSDPVTVYVEKHSTPADSIFVWGFAPEIYVSAARHAASRYVFTTFPAGMVPWYPHLTRAEEDHFAVPGARATLLHELRRAKPKLVLDVPSSLQGRSMRRYGQLRDFLLSHYCYDRTVAGGYGRVVDAYLRRDSAKPCEHAPPPLLLE